MVLAQRQKYRSVEQHRKLRNKPMHLWSINLWQRRQEYTIYWKYSLFSKWSWENCIAPCKRIKLEHSLTPYTKINANWVDNLNIKLDTIELLEENTGRTLFDINCGNIFLDPPPRVMKKKIKKWDLIKPKSFYTAKETINKTKNKPQDGRKSLQMKWPTGD